LFGFFDGRKVVQVRNAVEVDRLIDFVRSYLGLQRTRRSGIQGRRGTRIPFQFEGRTSL
jgi:hypothetical protein